MSILPETKSKDKAQKIMQVVCDAYGFTEEELKSKSSAHPLCFARQLAMTLTRQKANLSFERVGEIYDLHYSTVMYACKVLDKKKYSPEEREFINNIITKI